MSITRHFKGSTDSYGYGYFGYIEDGQLVLGENWPREGGITYRGTYKDAEHDLMKLKERAPRLYNSIKSYYAHLEKQRAEELKNNPSGILWKIKLYMTNGDTHNVMVRGLSESSVLMKLQPEKPELLIVQSFDGRVCAVATDKISFVEFFGG